MSVTQKQGIITCIPKGDRPKRFMKNWRPISLLNTAYKLFSAVIAERLKRFLPRLISTDQTGFMSNRYIGDNIRLIYDLMNYTESNNIPGMLFLIDFEKAFDSVSWSFVNKTLKFFGFGEDICRWFNVLYNDASSCLTVNGRLSPWFPVERGCRQGDVMYSLKSCV